MNLRKLENNVNRTLLFLVLCLLLPGMVCAQIGRPKGYDQGIVVSATKEASKVGVDILKKGGNAVDAAIAVHFALAVTFPVAGNLGGGGFMVIRKPNGTHATIDFREMAPSAAFEKMYQDENGQVIAEKSLVGHLASGVPGSVDGMIQAHQKHGSLPWKTLIEPSITLAKKGFNLSWQEAEGLNRTAEYFTRFEGSKKTFLRADGKPWKEDDLFKQPDLATTLNRIAHKGRAGFYEGKTAQLIVEEMQRGNGMITLDDLKSYQSVWRPALLLSYKDFTLITMAPPSSGGIAMGQILKMIEPYDIKGMGYHSADYIHLVTEAMKRAYADRAEHLGDPDFYPVPQKGLLDTSYLRNRMLNFDPAKALPSSEIGHGTPSPLESEETTHFSIVDSNGMAVAVTTTLNGGYGSFVTVSGAGFLLNNEMDDFSTKPGFANMYGLIGGRANAIEAKKRMLSSMTPTIVEEKGQLRMVLGTPGGSTIITTVLQTFLNMAVFGMDAQQAVAAPRFHHQWMPDRLQFDAFALSPDTQKQLELKGHTIAFRRGFAGRADNIYIDANGRRWGGQDPRGEDTALGY